MKFSHPLIRRLLLSIAIGIVVAAVISEGSYRLLREDVDRSPQEIEIVIPPGTAEQVANGEEALSLPEKMVFVRGDVLVVKNEDVANHQLGPVWVPPGATGRLVLEQVNKYRYGCSFVPSQYLGLDVLPPGASLTSRVLALAFVAPPTVVLIVLYSLLVIPLRRSVAETQIAPGGQKTPLEPRVSELILPEDEVALRSNGNGKTAG